MKRKSIGVAFFVAMLGASALALGYDGSRSDSSPDASGFPTAGWRIALKGTFDGGELGGGKGGACNGGSGYANHCESGGCICYTGTGIVSGAAGTGSFTFYESFDTDNIVSAGDHFDQCAPVFGEIDVEGSRDSEVIAFFGGNCQTAVQPPSPGFNEGGCYLATSKRYATGFAQCSGPYSANPSPLGGYRFTFTINGTAVRQ